MTSLVFPAPADVRGAQLAEEIAATQGAVEVRLTVVDGVDVLVVAGTSGQDHLDVDVVQAVIDSHVPTAPPTDPDDDLRAAIEAATDFASLKAALLGSKPSHAARVAARSKDVG